jgi:hypothetical protein
MRRLKTVARHERRVRGSRVPAIAALFLISIAFASCVNTANNASVPAHGASDSLPAGGIAPVLLFNGSGTSPNDVAPVEAIPEQQ